MRAVGVYDQIKKAFQDVIAPELQALRGDVRVLDQQIDGLDARLTTKIDGFRSETVSMKAELLAPTGSPCGTGRPRPPRSPRRAV
jgi:hypothetical protein